MLLCAVTGAIVIALRSTPNSTPEVQRYPEDASEAESRRLAEESVQVLPTKTYKTSELNQKDIESLPGLSEAQRKEVWERVKANQEQLRK